MLSDYPAPAFHFRVEFAHTPGLDAAFQEVSGIGPEMETEDVAEGGENRFVHRLPKTVKHPRLVLKRGIGAVASPLVKWCKTVLENDFATPVKPTSVLVTLLDENGLPLRVWSFLNAFPVKWEVDAFNSTKNEVAIESIELSYQYSKRVV